MTAPQPPTLPPSTSLTTDLISDHHYLAADEEIGKLLKIALRRQNNQRNLNPKPRFRNTSCFGDSKSEMQETMPLPKRFIRNKQMSSIVNTTAQNMDVDNDLKQECEDHETRNSHDLLLVHLTEPVSTQPADFRIPLKSIE